LAKSVVKESSQLSMALRETEDVPKVVIPPYLIRLGAMDCIQDKRLERKALRHSCLFVVCRILMLVFLSLGGEGIKDR
jgi:hypothetical protein